MAGIAETKLAKMAAGMATMNAASMAGIAEAKPAEMAAKMAVVNAASMAWLCVPHSRLCCSNGTLI